MSERPQVLFVCVHNAGRSQMAAALLARAAGDRIEVRSAGSMPADDLHPEVVSAMAEIGIDMSSAHPKVLDPEEVRDSDLVITMGCGDACPVFPGTRYLDWDLPDPVGRTPAEVRAIREQISALVDRLVVEMLGEPAS